MVRVIYVNEEIHYNKSRLCGWSFKKVKYRVDYKTKKTRFYTYLGYCQLDNRDYDEDTSVENISIHGSYLPFPEDKEKSRLTRDVRNVEYVWGEGYKYTELIKKSD